MFEFYRVSGFHCKEMAKSFQQTKSMEFVRRFYTLFNSFELLQLVNMKGCETDEITPYNFIDLQLPSLEIHKRTSLWMKTMCVLTDEPLIKVSRIFSLDTTDTATVTPIATPLGKTTKGKQEPSQLE